MAIGSSLLRSTACAARAVHRRTVGQQQAATKDTVQPRADQGRPHPWTPPPPGSSGATTHGCSGAWEDDGAGQPTLAGLGGTEQGGQLPAGMCVTKEDFAVAEGRVRPSALRELAVEVPRVGWADVGGLQDVKQR